MSKLSLESTAIAQVYVSAIKRTATVGTLQLHKQLESTG